MNEELKRTPEEMSNIAYVKGYEDGYRSMIARLRNTERVSDEWLNEVIENGTEY